VFVVDGGASAWAALGHALETGAPVETVAGLAEAQAKIRLVSPKEVTTNPSKHVIFVDTSQDFARSHTPGAKWISRSWLEIEIGDAVASKDASITVTCSDGVNSILAAATLSEIGYTHASVLDGGMTAWQKAGLPVEQGLTGIIRPPSDINYLGVDRSYGEMMNYLRWETALGEKYEAD
jgi:rhodanese-related sulfurtransferase